MCTGTEIFPVCSKTKVVEALFFIWPDNLWYTTTDWYWSSNYYTRKLFWGKDMLCTHFFCPGCFPTGSKVIHIKVVLKLPPLTPAHVHWIRDELRESSAWCQWFWSYSDIHAQMSFYYIDAPALRDWVIIFLYNLYLYILFVFLTKIRYYHM